MLRRISSIAIGLGELLRAEGEMLLTQSRRACAWAGIALMGVLAISIGALGILVAGAAALAQVIGWIWSVAAVSAALVVAGVITCVAARSWLRSATRRIAMPAEPRLRSDEARRMITGEDEPREEAPTESGGEETTFADRVTGFAMNNPGVTAGAAFAAAALFGPWRTLKLVARGAMIAGIASEFLREHVSPQREPPAADAGSPGSRAWGEPRGHAADPPARPISAPPRPERPAGAPVGAAPPTQ